MYKYPEISTIQGVLMDTAIELHQKAKTRANHFRTSQTELLDILIRIDRHLIYKQFGYPSLHVYCTQWLGLTDSEAYTLSGVAKKSHEIPQMKSLIEEGKLHLSNARRIVSVITPLNQDTWLEKASSLTQEALRREIVIQHPEVEPKPKIKSISETRSRLTLGISRDLEDKLKRACDVLSQKERRLVTMEEAIGLMTDSFLKKQDPIEKAKKKLGLNTKHKPAQPGRYTQATVTHVVNLRDSGQCRFVYSDGKRCQNTKWLEKHHINHVSQGGMSVADNLVTLCSVHHGYQHRRYNRLGNRLELH